MKTGQSRIDDAVDYIYGIGKSELANHILTTMQAGNASFSSIGKELSLGSRPDNEDDPQYAGNTQKRQALRALLLCQRVYFSNLWAQFIGHGGVRSNQTFLAPDWKTTSLAHWGNCTEQEIGLGIYTFSVTTSDMAKLADAANSIPDQTAPTPDLTLTRAKPNFPGLTSCYGSVMTWMFKSGLVSYRWYMKNQGSNNKATLRDAFGPARVIWKADRAFGDGDHLPFVGRGHIVHLYVDNPLRWNGHWLISKGDGTACACNNDTENGDVQNNYSDHCSLDKQFLFGYKHALEGRAGAFEQGVAEVIDPLEIPGRL